MQRKSSILGPNIVDFGTHFDISSFPGPNMQHTLIQNTVFDRQTTDFYSKMDPKMDPKITEFGGLFSLLFLLLIWTLISTILSPKWSQNGTPNLVFFETSDLAKVQ